MKWTRVNKAFFNTELMKAFHWSAGKLWIWWLGEDEPETYADPDREHYLDLCRRLILTPVKEDE